MSELYIETCGVGPQHYVLLHGWAMHGGIFAPLTRLLARHGTVHVVDLPGHGRSRDSHVPLALSACAAAIAARTPRATWVGWSLGGLHAITAALEEPEQVAALAIICSSPRLTRAPDWDCGTGIETLASMARDLDSHYRVTLERFLELEAMGSRSARQDMQQLHADVFARGTPDPRILKEGIAILEQTDLRPRLPAIRCPNTWIAGARDRLIPWRAMAWSAKQAGGTFTRIAHAGHAPFIGHAEVIADAVAGLLPAAAAHYRIPA